MDYTIVGGGVNQAASSSTRRRHLCRSGSASPAAARSRHRPVHHDASALAFSLTLSRAILCHHAPDEQHDDGTDDGADKSGSLAWSIKP